MHDRLQGSQAEATGSSRPRGRVHQWRLRTADSLATGITIDTETGTEVPSVLLEPQSIFPENVADVIADGYTTADKICTTEELKAACTKYGIS